MATYVFTAMDLTGAKAGGEVDADSKQVVADQLKARGLIVLDIKAKHASKEISLDFMKRVKPTDLTILTRQLATMISSGMTILRSLYVLEAQTENKLLADIIAADNHGDGRLVSSAFHLLADREGAPQADLLARTNPRRILDDEELQEVPSLPLQESWWDRIRSVFDQHGG